MQNDMYQNGFNDALLVAFCLMDDCFTWDEIVEKFHLEDMLEVNPVKSNLKKLKDNLERLT
jgi:hypothetical protein